MSSKKTFQTKASQLQGSGKPKNPLLKDSTATAASAELTTFCLVCAEAEPKYWAMAACGHRICYVCSLRLRGLYGTKNCPICKSENECVIIAKRGSYQDLLRPGCPENSPCAIKYENQIVKTDCEVLLELRCPKSKCTHISKDRESLQKHVKTAHDLLLCEICLKHKKCFTCELQLFTRPALIKHQNSGDGKTFSGHPQCSVCAVYFYGEDELTEHCRMQHELCHICQRLNRPNRYFKNYTVLEEHFEKEHYLCPEPVCKELKFVVFESELEYKRHLAEVHLSHQKLQRSQQRQLQRLNVTFGEPSSRSRTTETSYNGPSSSRSSQATTAAPTPQVRLTPDQRTQIASTLFFGQVTDDLASRMQSLSLYQQRNEQFMESLRVSHHLTQAQVQTLCKDARDFQKSEIDGVEFVNRVTALVTDDHAAPVLKELVDLQLEGLRKRELDAALNDYINKSRSFPALPQESVKSSASAAKGPWNTRPVASVKEPEKKKVVAPFKGGILQIKPSGARPQATAAAPDPSRNPLMLRELAGGSLPSRRSKSKSQGESSYNSPKAQLPSFSAAALGNVTTRYAPVASSSGSSKQSRPQMDDEEFPSLLKNQPNATEPLQSGRSSAAGEPLVGSKNAFFAANERDEFDSFTIGGTEATSDLDEKAPMPQNGGKKKKQVVFRYGQSWNI